MRKSAGALNSKATGIVFVALRTEKKLRHGGAKPCQVSFLCGDLARVKTSGEKHGRHYA